MTTNALQTDLVTCNICNGTGNNKFFVRITDTKCSWCYGKGKLLMSVPTFQGIPLVEPSEKYGLPLIIATILDNESSE